MFENRAQRMFAYERKEIREVWRKLHEGKLHDFCKE
jgi:hypothetical protein